MATAMTEPKLISTGKTARYFSDFVHTVHKASSRNSYVSGEAHDQLKEWGSRYVSKAAMGETSGTIGGYTVPIEFSTKLLKSIAEHSFIYPRATVVPMGAERTLCPTINVETAQAAGIPSFFGGMTLRWGFSQAPSETEPTFRQVELNAWDLLGYSNISNQMLGDIGEEGNDALLDIFGKAGAWFAEYAFLRGTGSAQLMPMGIVNCNGKKSVARAGSNAIAIADIANMAAEMLPYSWANAIWACSPACLGQIMKLSNYIVNIGEESPGLAGILLGRPLYVTDKLPNLGTAGDLVFFDPSLYIIGQRTEVVIDVSDQQLFQTNQTQFRTWLRLDGVPQVSSPITMAGDGSTTVSPYVILAA